MNKYRLALDLGTNSIGWCVLDMERKDEHVQPIRIIDMGVRVFPDGRNPKDGTSNAVTRREARGMRRNRDRFLERRNKLLETLVRYNLMPQDDGERWALTALDPYALRARGVTEALTPYEFGRAIFHLNQRRGFKSNRKSDAKASDAGAIKQAVKELTVQIAATEALTFGHYLYLRREAGKHVRSRLKTRRAHTASGREKKEDYYEFYPSREVLSEEFETLWQTQKKYYPDVLTDVAKAEIHRIIFYQRPLKEPVIGHCTFERSEQRAPKALPIIQRSRIYQELNHLQVIDEDMRSRPLTKEERDVLADMLCKPGGKKSGKSELTFDKMRKALFPNKHISFSHESDKRKGLEADHTSALMAHVDRFGAQWYCLTDEEQERIIENLLRESDEEALIRLLMDEWNLSRPNAETISATGLPQGYSRLGRTATRKIVEELERDVIPYSEAVVRAGYGSHSQFGCVAALDRLPYYGEVLERHVIPDPEKGGHPAAPQEQRYGRVGNPTVHVALNQLRKVVNELVKIYGKPAEIHIEVLRELKNSLQKRQEIETAQQKNQNENDACREEIEQIGQRVNRENIQRLRLWREMPADNRCCIYTGEIISKSILFTEAVEIDHILPFSRTWDDSMANKVLCMRRANREKSNQSPFEAWGRLAEWEDIFSRSEILPKNKRWRFTEDAMERWNAEGGFLARQLTDSQYIAKLAREYLCCLFPQERQTKVLCLPGRLTGLFRKHLGLEDILDELNSNRQEYNATRGEKNRADHRHHAIDALVVGVMDRAFLQCAASVSARLEKEGVYKLLKGLHDPWPSFHEDARDALGRIVVSHKPDHGIEGALHNLTAYGYAKNEDLRGNAIHRVNTSEITLKNLQNIKGKKLRARLLAHLAGLSVSDAFDMLETLDKTVGRASGKLAALCAETTGDDKAVASAIREFFELEGMRRVRLIEEIGLRPIRDRQGHVYKGVKPDGNAYLDIYLSADGKKWEGELVTRFDANQRKAKPQGNTPAQRKNITRLFNRDMVEMEHEGERKFFYIQKMSENQIALAEHFEADADARTRNKNDPFRFVYKGSADMLRKSKVRFLKITPAGRIRYLSGIYHDSQGD